MHTFAAMPHPSSLLSAFARRDTVDKVMFGWVRGMTRALPGVSTARALEMFAKEMGIEDGFNVESQKTRFERMLKEFYQDQKSTA